MAYVAQLLPDLTEARVIRDALAEYVKRDDIGEEERDAAWSVLADITKKLRERRPR